MSIDQLRVLIVLSWLAGQCVAIAWPFVRKKLENEALKFQWAEVIGRLGAGILAGLTALMSTGLQGLDDLVQYGWLGVVYALVTGVVVIGASSMGHQAQKTPTAIKAFRVRKNS